MLVAAVVEKKARGSVPAIGGCVAGGVEGVADLAGFILVGVGGGGSPRGDVAVQEVDGAAVGETGVGED